MTAPVPAEVLEALHQGRVPETPLTEDLAEQVLDLMQAGDLPWPRGKAQWMWIGPDDEAFVFFAAKHGRLPSNFRHWSWRDAAGWTVAHEAAKYGKLPPTFNDWSLWGAELFTVAHIQAWVGYPLPLDFDLWDMKDANGNTVAHFAARRNILPIHFNQWFLTNGDGKTVAEIALNHGAIDQARYDQIMLEHEQSERSKSASALTMSF